MGTIYQIALPDRDAPVEGDAGPLRFQATDGTFFLSDRDLCVLRAQGVAHRVLREIDSASIPVQFVLPHDGAVNDLPPESARLAVLARLLAEGRADGSTHIRSLGRNRSVPPDGFLLDRSGGARRYVWQVVPACDARNQRTLRSRFQSLLTEVARPDTRVVLSLGSGGLKLFAHAPVLRLLERVGVTEHIDEFWGTSGGALAALLYCHGLSPQSIEQTGYDLYTGRYHLAIHPSRLQVVRNLVREAFMPQSAELSGGFVDCAAGLRRMLERYCETLRPSRPFYCVAYNLNDCASEVLTPEPVPEHLEGLAVQTDALEAALASAAVPILFVPKRIARGGRSVSYVDGSTTEDVPLLSVVRKWDRDRAAGGESRSRLLILGVKLSGTSGVHRSLEGAFGKVRVLQIVASAGMDAMYQQSLEILRARPDVGLLKLDLSDPHADFFDLRRIPEYIRAGKEAFPGQLAEIEAALRARTATPPTQAAAR